MTLIDKIVHYKYFLLFKSVLKFVYLSSEVEKKSDTFLHSTHPGPFDPYIWRDIWRDVVKECTPKIYMLLVIK